MTPKFIVHTRGPNYSDIEDTEPGKEKTMKRTMRMCVYSALETGMLLKAQSIALSPISTGHLQFPVKLCANYMVSNVIEWASVVDQGDLTTINIYVSSDEEFNAFSKELVEVHK